MDLLRASASIDELIERRATERSNANTLAEMYAESTRRQREQQRERHRWEWVRHFELMAENHARLSEENRQRATALIESPGEGG